MYRLGSANRRLAVWLIACLAVAALVCVASYSSHADNAGAAKPLTKAQIRKGTARQLLARYSILRTKKARASQDVRVPMGLGIDEASIRQVDNGSSDARIWAARSADGLCILVQPLTNSLYAGGPAASCGDARSIRNGVALSFGGAGFAPDEVLKAGLVPNGTDFVNVTYGNGQVQRVAVHGNSYVVHATSPVTAIQWNNDGDSVSNLTEDGNG